ncbi:MAG: transketolase family protein, partial [Spirochaetota bacterium]|nr:transketolase family protein [Spirochaetota bacterium]
ARKTGAFVTCENHQVVNFLGSAVAEVLAEEHPAFLGRIGIQDEFGQVGTLDFLKKDYGLTAADIAAKAREVLKKKNPKKN